MTTSPLFKRVPAEPTREMCEAMPVLPALTQDDLRFKALGWPMHAIQNRHRLVAALAASPEPPAEEVETLRERVKELEEALAPFSLIGGPLNEVTEGVFPDDASARFLNLGELKAKHFRGAATALDRARAKGDG